MPVCRISSQIIKTPGGFWGKPPGAPGDPRGTPGDPRGAQGTPGPTREGGGPGGAPPGVPIPGGEIKIDVIFFPRGLPDPRVGGPQGGSPRGFQGAVRASHLAKKSKDKTPGVFFHAAFDFDTPRP